MTPQVPAYTPSIYRPGLYGRFRLYPRQVVTAIPGAGYRVKRLVWADQQLDLDGGHGRRRRPAGNLYDGHANRTGNYGAYANVPLRGIGSYDGVGDFSASDAAMITTVAAQLIRDPEGTMRAQGPRIVSAIDKSVLTPIVDEIFNNAKPHLLKYLGPPILVLYLMTGLSTYYSYLVLKHYSRPAKVTANRRRKRRRRSR